MVCLCYMYICICFFFGRRILGQNFAGVHRGSRASDGRHRYGIADDDVVPWRQDGKGRLLQGTYKPNMWGLCDLLWKLL